MQRMVHEANAKIVTTEGNVGIFTNVDGYSVRREWLRGHRETAVRFLRGLLMANEIVQKDPTVAIRLWGQEMGIRESWAETIYDDVPPPLIRQWTNPRYAYSLVRGSPLHRRLTYLANYLYEEKMIAQPVSMHDIMDPSLIAEVLGGRGAGH